MTTKLRAASFQDNAVTTAKIAAAAVTDAKLAGSIATAKLVQGSSFLTSVATSNMPTGSVLQVLQNESTSTVNFTSSSYTNTGFNLSITPSATSSKIFMIFDFTWYSYRNNIGPETGGAFKLVRDSTDIKAFEDSAGYTIKVEGAASNYWECFRVNLTHLDSPNSTSAVNYKLHHNSKLDGYNSIKGPTKITLMEIAG
tara:strand:+ start:414 stop:1007 length:594 start_codon:yes stop_codon:yes gene_type:complete